MSDTTEILEIKKGMVKLRRPTKEIHISLIQNPAKIVRLVQDEENRVYITVERQ